MRENRHRKQCMTKVLFKFCFIYTTFKESSFSPAKVEVFCSNCCIINLQIALALKCKISYSSNVF